MNDIKRFLKNINLGLIGLIVCFVGIVGEMLEFAAELFMTGDAVRIDAINFVYLIINVLFYFYIARMFLIAAKEKDFSLARFGIGVFVITEYIMPAIRMLFFGGFSGVILYFPYFLLSGAAVGVAYFVFMVLEWRNSGKNYYIPMMIIGILLFLINLAFATSNIYTIVVMIGAPLTAYEIALCIVTALAAINDVLLGFLFMMYPIYGFLRRKGKM